MHQIHERLEMAPEMCNPSLIPVLFWLPPGSGKTAAFALPVLQLVMEAKRREAEGKGATSGPAGEAKDGSDWRMSGVDRDGMLGIEGSEGIMVSASAPRWVGGRATLGVSGGKAYYEVSMLDNGLARVGWSTTTANYNLGTDKYGYGFGGTGMKSQGGKFDPYGYVCGIEPGTVFFESIFPFSLSLF